MSLASTPASSRTSFVRRFIWTTLAPVPVARGRDRVIVAREFVRAVDEEDVQILTS